MPRKANKLVRKVGGHVIEILGDTIYVDSLPKMRVPIEFIKWLTSEDEWIRNEALHILLPHILPPDEFEA